MQKLSFGQRALCIVYFLQKSDYSDRLLAAVALPLHRSRRTRVGLLPIDAPIKPIARLSYGRLWTNLDMSCALSSNP